MDASEIYLLEKTQCERGDTSKTRRIYFSNRRWTNQNRWRRSGIDQFEEKVTLFFFLGESEGSFPPRHDSLPDAGEAINDSWSMSGNFIFRHHIEPRVKLYSPREQSFPVPLKYIDVSRTTHTNLDVKHEKRIDDSWNIDGSRDLSNPWTGFTQFTLLEEQAPDGYMWSGNEKTAHIQARSFVARTLEINGKARQAQGEAKVV